jgi:hypothetical protein
MVPDVALHADTSVEAAEPRDGAGSDGPQTSNDGGSDNLDASIGPDAPFCALHAHDPHLVLCQDFDDAATGTLGGAWQSVEYYWAMPTVESNIAVSTPNAIQCGPSTAARADFFLPPTPHQVVLQAMARYEPSVADGIALSFGGKYTFQYSFGGDTGYCGTNVCGGGPQPPLFAAAAAWFPITMTFAVTDAGVVLSVKTDSTSAVVTPATYPLPEGGFPWTTPAYVALGTMSQANDSGVEYFDNILVLVQ